MKTHVIFLVTFFALSNSVFAQEFDLKQYKTVDYERSILDLGFNFQNKGNTETEKNDSLNYKMQRSDLEVFGNIDLNLNDISYTREKVITHTGNILAQNIYNRSVFDFNENNDLNKEDINWTQSYHVSASRDILEFYNMESNQFWNYGYGFFHNQYGNGDKLQNDTTYSALKNSSNTNRGELYATIKHGVGRMEQVDNAVVAIYILNELEALGKLNVEIDENIITGLADKITHLAKRRFYDSRLYKREFLKELSGYMLDERLINDESVELFSAINDYYFYAGIGNRQSGKRIDYGVKPSFGYNWSNYKYNQRENYRSGNTTASIEFPLSYAVQTPYNIKWQTGYNLNLIYTINYYNSGDELFAGTLDMKNLMGSFQYSVSYFPNTRTKLSSSFYSGLNFFGLIERRDGYLGTLIFDLNGNYYISERLRLNALLNLRADPRYLHKNLVTEDLDRIVPLNKFELYHNFNLSFTYYIF